MTDDERASPDDALLPRPWLEEWTVPDVPSDLSSRVLSRMREGVVIQPPVVIADRRSSALVTGAAVFAAAAAAAAQVITLVRPGRNGDTDAPAPVPAAAITPEASAPQPGPVVVAGDELLERVGHLVIDVRPPDASVTIDGRAIVGPTPFVAANLPAGPHEIAVTRAGFQPWRKTIDVPAAELQLPIALVVDDAPATAPTPSPAPIAKAPRPGTTKPDAPTSPSSLRAEIVGSIDRDVIRRVVRAHIGEVRECYNEGLMRKPDLRGRISVSFVIDDRGRATEATVAESTLDDATVEACVVRAVGRWRFPAPPPGMGNVKVTYPFLLEPG